MSVTTAWVIGSIKSLAHTVTINASPQSVTGSRYLYHGTSSLSILGGMVTAMTAAGLATPTAVLTEDRKVKLTNGAAFTVTWTNTTLRDLLGFTGDLASAASHTATNVSPLLWSPGHIMRPELSPLGTAGIERPLVMWTASPNDGSVFVVSHGSRVDQRWSVEMVDTDRVFTSAESGGQWVTLFNDSLALGYSFNVYPSVSETAGGTSTASLSDILGPYVLAAPNWAYMRSRGFEYVEARANVSIPCRIVPQYT
jgi:hypothetical protein